MPKTLLPRIQSVSAGPAPFTLVIGWVSGQSTTVDLSAILESYAVYKPLRRSPTLFQAVRLGEYGTDIVWNDECDMSAVTLWRLAEEQTGQSFSLVS